MIELRNINRTYKPKKGEAVRALKNIDLKFGDTGMVFVLGKSGSGKSTLLNVIGGLDKYDDGDLIIQGKSSRDFKQSDFDSYRNTMIGFIFQEYNVLDEFTVAQNIALALQLQGRKATNEAINDILDAVDLNGYARRKPNELSGGQKQRVAIARALVKDPKVIMADEPTGALDSVTGTQVLETLEKLSETRLVIVVSHDREYAETYGTRIVEFADGEIISDVTREKEDKSKKETKPLNFTPTNIEIKQGYELTAEDVNVINKYLKRNNKDSSIEKIFNQATFNDTDQKNIEMSREHYHSIKSKLPFRTSLKIGASALKHKTFRLFISILLASVAFAMFALADTMGSYDKVNTTIQSIIDSEIDYLALERYRLYEHSDGWTENISMGYDDVDVAALNTRYNNKIKFKGIYYNQQLRLTISENLFDSFGSNDYYFYKTEFSGLLEFKTSELTDFNSTVIGRLPIADNEVAISQYMLGVFTKFGYRDLNNPTIKVNIVNANSIIGKDLKVGDSTFTVVGVVDTNFDTERYETLKNPTGGFSDYFLINEYSTITTFSHHNVLFVNDGFVDRMDVEETVTLYMNSYNMSLNDNVNQESFYTEHISVLNPAAQAQYTFFKGIVLPLNNDFLVSKDYFYNRIQNELNTYYDYVIDYLDGFSDQVIYDTLEDHPNYTAFIKPVAEWDENDQDYYRSEIFYLYYNDMDNEVLSPLPKNNMDLKDEILQNFIDNYEPINVQIEISNYRTGEVLSLTGRIIGYYEPNLFSSYGVTIVTPNFFNNFEFQEQGKYASVIASFSSNDRDILELVVKDNYTFDSNNTVSELRNEVMATLSQVNSLIETLSVVFLYVGIGFVVFASLLLINYITISISYKKKEIGILRAIGARGNDVVGIFFKEAMIIALINFFIATGMAIFTIIYLNNLLRNEYGILITILNFGVRQIVLMLAVSVIIAFVSSSIPVSRIARKRPIDAIRDR